MKNRKSIIILALLLSLSAYSQQSTPPMGWNSFDSYGVYLYEKAAFENLEAMAEKLKPFGYQYFVIDNGWFGEYQLQEGTRYSKERHASDVNINEYGLFQPSNCYFPNGFGKLIERCHQLGLKFGVHLMRGIPRKAVQQNLPIFGTAYHASDIADTVNICSWCHYNYGVDMSKPGAQEFYNSLINQLASWGVDFLKIDDIVPFPDEAEAIIKAVKQCGRPLTISLSPGDKVPADRLSAFKDAQMLRVTGDVWDSQGDIDKCFKAWRHWSGKSIPGLWFDLDMIPFGNLLLMSPKTIDSKDVSKSALYAGRGYSRKSELTPPQMRTFITQRALSASPLMVGGDLPTMDDYSLSLLTNKEMIKCNQSGIMGSLIYEKDGVEVWSVKASKKEQWFGIFNRSSQPEQITIPLSQLGISKMRKIKNIWNNADIKLSKGNITAVIKPYDVLFVTF